MSPAVAASRAAIKPAIESAVRVSQRSVINEKSLFNPEAEEAFGLSKPVYSS
jgi:hypothetical protein